jgi:hypothetical protein
MLGSDCSVSTCSILADAGKLYSQGVSLNSFSSANSCKAENCATAYSIGTCVVMTACLAETSTVGFAADGQSAGAIGCDASSCTTSTTGTLAVDMGNSWTSAVVPSTVPPSPSNIVVTFAGSGDWGATTNISMLSIAAQSGGGPGIKILAFRIPAIHISGGGTLTVTLSGSATFSSMFVPIVCGSVDWNYNASPPVAKQTGANTFTIILGTSYALGSNPGVDVSIHGF